MSFPKLLAFTKKVSDMADKPSGTPAEIKANFDAAVDELRETHNLLIDGLKSTSDTDSGAKNIGAKVIPGLTGSDVQALLESLNGNKVSKTFSGWTDVPLWTASGWANYGNDFETCQYNIDEKGWVSCKGTATGGAGGSWIAQMPVGARPLAKMKFNCPQNNGAMGVTINPDGTFVVDASVQGGTWIDLSPIRYHAGQ